MQKSTRTYNGLKSIKAMIQLNKIMAQLAIKGHPTRGKEVIQLLEMLGGNNIHNYGGTFNECYIIDNNKICTIYTSVAKIDNCTIFTLEEFLDKYPYKVGDKISSKYLKNYKIEKMEWEDTNNKIIYKLQGMGWYNTNELQPYKEETMEEITIDDFKANTKEWLIDKLESMSKDNALQAICNIHDELHKPQYPKTYEECCDILQLEHTFELKDLTIDEEKLMDSFIRLKRCRDAYWKIAGEQMKLGKPWEPATETVYCISRSNNIIKSSYRGGKSNILEFPTEEMRDAFYENFKDLIENVKELL